MEISHFMYIFKTRKHGFTCDVRNFTFHVQFQAMTHEISCGIRNFMCPAHFQDQGHETFTVHFLYISCGISRVQPIMAA